MDDNSRPTYGVSTKVERLALLIQNEICKRSRMPSGQVKAVFWPLLRRSRWLGSWFPEVRQEFVDLAGGVRADARQDVTKIVPGVEAVALAASYQ